MPTVQPATYSRNTKYADKSLANIGAASHVGNTGVPTQIRCNSCEKVKNSAAFSKNKMAVLVKHMSKIRGFDASKIGHIPCIGCSGGQITELRCNWCDLTKAITKFNKTQRKKDEPMCETCMMDRKATEPGGSSSDSNPYGERSDSSDDDDDDDETHISSALGGVNLNGSVSGSAATFRGGAPSISAGSGVPLGSSNASTIAEGSVASSVVDTSNRGGWGTNPTGNRTPGSVASSRAPAPKRPGWTKPPKGLPQRSSKDSDQEASDSPQVSSEDDSDGETIYSL